MSLSTRTYDELWLTIKSFCGASLREEEKSRINQLINFAAKRAYQATPYWERYLITAEPRTASRNRIDSTEDSYHVYGAGTEAVNGLYVRNGSSADGNPAYTKYDTDGTALYNLYSEASVVWYIASTAINAAVVNGLYYIVSASSTPPLSGWVADGSTVGVAPTPRLVDVAEIDTFLRIDQYDTFQDRASRPIGFHAIGGVAKLHDSDSSDVLYVTYKKAHTDVYGDGTGGTTSTIPDEWFNYMALHASYMFLSGERMSNPNGYTGIAYQEVKEAMQDELMRLEEQGLYNIRPHVSTHLSYDRSLV